ncbi:conserved Plasmodium protein, unknown function [Plasmodium gaboni]|uniref:PUB domain-containing protein n=1 Tax=Plasmodium gaboni TaxID=647221 RepID=A0ABY1UR77_9APIC|nr:conserved Plasmodium protein, unknown function [Plasmodium gaboni]
MNEENEVVKLLVKVGKNINKNEEQLRPFIKKIVEDNWLDSIESLKSLTDDEWFKLQLPLRLVDEIKKELHIKKEEQSRTRDDKNKDNNNDNNNNMEGTNRYDEIHCEKNEIVNCNKKFKKNLKEEKEDVNMKENISSTNVIKENITHSNNINNYASSDYDNKRTLSNYVDHNNKSSKLINDMNMSRNNNRVYEHSDLNKKEGFHYSIIKCNKDILENMISKQIEDINKEDIFYLSNEDDYTNNYDNCNSSYSYSEEKTRTINSINACEKLKKIPIENLKIVLPILCKIVKNILINPNILNTRILKSTNNIMKNKILIYEEVKNLLLSIGFVRIYIFYVMIKVDTLLLLCIYESLKNISKNIIKIDDCSNINFDPFKSNIVCVDTLKKKKNVFHANDNVDILLKQKKEQMEKLMNQPIEKNPKIYKQKNYNYSQDKKEKDKELKKKNHNSVLDAQEKDEDDTENEENEENEEDFSYIIANIKNFGKEQTFKSKTKLELEKISKAKVYSKTIIKILFPDDYILELSFSSGTLFRDVNEAVKGFLNDSIISKNWFLYETPGIRKFDPQKSLSFYNLIPHALLRFKLDHQDDNFIFSSFLSNEAIEKYLISS